MKLRNIILIGIGAFAAYTLAILAYAYTTKEGIDRIFYVATYAPWLLVSKDFAAWFHAA